MPSFLTPRVLHDVAQKDSGNCLGKNLVLWQARWLARINEQAVPEAPQVHMAVNRCPRPPPLQPRSPCCCWWPRRGAAAHLRPTPAGSRVAAARGWRQSPLPWLQGSGRHKAGEACQVAGWDVCNKRSVAQAPGPLCLTLRPMCVMHACRCMLGMHGCRGPCSTKASPRAAASWLRPRLR